MDRMNLVQAKNIEGRDKPIWLRIGSVFMEAGKIKGIKLDVLPLPDEKNEVWLRVFEDDDGKSQAPAGGGSDPWGNG